ncbi:hypothetical protein HYW76_03140 [Candidatus Pacearchaeota archaeon]|nr:hypothetical protein [Candidatus Pacearchaeota archaeon]
MINKSRIFSKKAGISYFEIAILIISSFAFCYFVSEADKIIESMNDSKPSIENKSGNKKLIMILGFFSRWIERSKINLVSAEQNVSLEFSREAVGNLALNCCPLLKNNAVCQDVVNNQCGERCAVACLPTRCEQTSNCQQGCCFDSDEGICSNSVPKESCERNSGTWSSDRNCNMQECSLGCCVLGRNALFITETRCEKLSVFYNYLQDFRPNIRTEIGCLALSEQQEEGACLTSRGCKFLTKTDCLRMNGNANYFYPNSLCSNPLLNTTCTKQNSTSCIEGKDEVYWIDSCGNRENIYSSNREESWNNGSVLNKENSCSSISENCGNCNRFLGSICGKEGNKFACKSLDCKNAPDSIGKKDRKNGESWCVYQSYIGEGKDVVGSRHYKYYCLDGEVKVEACGDYRTGICVENEIEIGSGNKFSNSACRINRASECESYNIKKDGEKAKEKDDRMKRECLENEDCETRELNFGLGYKFEICSPKYPIGFNLNSEDAEINKKICNQASFKCVKVMTKKISGWECVSGCDCDTEKFTKQMNEWCISVGDCGGKANILGEVTDFGYSVIKGERISLEKYKEYAKPVEGQRAVPGNFSGLLSSKYGWGAGKGPGDYSLEDASNSVMLATAGLAGTALVSGAIAVGIHGGISAISFSLAGGVTPLLSWGATSGVFAGIGNAAIGAAIGAVVGYVVAKLFGLEGDAVLAVVGVGAAAGVAAGVLASPSLIGGGAAICAGPHLLICAVIALVIIALVAGLMKLLGIGKVKKINVQFNCEPWQAVRGGENCGKCKELNKDGLQPCTKYRCQSLGQTCQLINEGTRNEECVDINPNDINPPIIKPWEGFISEGYKYSEITDESFKISGNNGECLTEFSPILFGIITNEPSQCKMDSVHTENLDDMEFYFGDSNLYKTNHSMAFNVPSFDAISSELREQLEQEELGQMDSIILDRLGNLTYYLRCVDKKGNSNIREYSIRTCVNPGKDLTSPYVVSSIPVNNGFIPMNKTEAELKIFVSEPANCRFGSVDSGYESLMNNFSCETGLEDSDLYGWPCSANLTGLNSAENKVYIKCKDQPWLPDENTSRNTMQNSQIITIKKAETSLVIAGIEPNATLTFGREPTSATLKVYTSGGAENGKAICSYSFSGWENMIEMRNTYSSQSSQIFDMLMRGNYNVYIRCRDIAGDEATGMTNLNINIDNVPPRIIRVYNRQGLKIITNEDSVCVYTNRTCFYNWENGTGMTGIEREHNFDFVSGEKYYIKCKDIWNNKPDECSMVIRAT